MWTERRTHRLRAEQLAGTRGRHGAIEKRVQSADGRIKCLLARGGWPPTVDDGERVGNLAKDHLELHRMESQAGMTGACACRGGKGPQGDECPLS